MRTRLLSAVLVPATLCVGILSCDLRRSPNEPTPVCSITISPGSLTFGSEGGTANVTVTTPAGCEWSVTTSPGWIAITAGATGSGPGTLAYSVAANPATESRSSALTVGSQSHTITQQGRPPAACTYDLSPTRAEFAKDAAAGTFAVTAPADCPWAAISNASWLVVTSGQGSGTGSVSYAVAGNPEVAGRNATITVAGRTFTVAQMGDIADCQYSVAPVDFRPCMPGGSVTATVTTQTSCPWTAAPNASWLGVPSGASGTGSGTITITFPDNYDAPREGIVMVRWPTPTAGQNIRVAQAGCSYAVSRSVFSFLSSGGTGTFDVIQQSEPNTCGGATQDRCVWTAQTDAPWITITSSLPRSGDNPVSFTVATNDGTASRVGRITVRDKVVTLTQAGR
jgi:BACON domain-containing protein/all-beta uncharacterized protein